MKNRIRLIHLVALFTLFAAAFPGPVCAAEKARVDVILVRAGSGEGGVDKALRPYASNLQRLFRFGSYQQVSRQSLTVGLPGSASVQLAQGQSLSLQASPGQGKALKAEINWQRGNQTLLHTRIQLSPGSPAILGGPRSRDATWLLILQLR
jgi:hypothetical protein